MAIVRILIIFSLGMQPAERYHHWIENKLGFFLFV
jgi:hypothetical protein